MVVFICRVAVRGSIMAVLVSGYWLAVLESTVAIFGSRVAVLGSRLAVS